MVFWPGVRAERWATVPAGVAHTLKAAGQLTPARLATAIATLQDADPRTTVTDPFAGAVGPLYTLGAPPSHGLNA